MKAWKTVAASLIVGLSSAASAGTAADALDARTLWSDPAARAYLSLDFGATGSHQHNPLRAGLRIDRDNSLNWTQLKPIASINFDRAGLADATLNGIPMVARDPVLYQQDGDIVYNWTDWGLVALGVVGLGFIIYEIADNDSDPDPQPVDNGNGGNGGNGDNGDIGDGLLGGLLGLQGDNAALSSREYRAWMDGGTGQMGDLD